MNFPRVDRLFLRNVLLGICVIQLALLGRGPGPQLSNVAAFEVAAPGVAPFFTSKVLVALRTHGVTAALDDIRILQASGVLAPTDPHSLAHAVGLVAVLEGAPVGTVFANCREEFDYGCYHGAIEQLLRTKKQITPTGFADLCPNEVLPDPAAMRRYGSGCWHGLGHGIFPVLGYELPLALSYCDALKTEVQDTCGDGVFMERTSAEYSGQLPAADPAQPFALCASVDTRYTRACYRERIKVVASSLHFDWPKTIGFCRDVPPAALRPCYEGIGRQARLSTMTSIPAATDVCATISNRYFEACIYGVLVSDPTSFPRADIPPYCANMREADERLLCADLYAGRLLRELQTPEARIQACAEIAEIDVRTRCLRQTGAP